MKPAIGVDAGRARPISHREARSVHRFRALDEWSPQLWIGCSFRVWLRILIHNHFAIHWSRWHIALLCTLVSIYHSVLALVQKLLFLNAKAAKTCIGEPPLFIVGHWRTGTTLVHELLTLDERHTGPTSFQCFRPHVFLLTERFESNITWMFPAHRPMDNMDVRPHSPQEEEFAMCLLGQPSPYLTIAFPNRKPQYPEYLDLEGLTPSALKSWKEALFRFLQQVYYRRPKRLVLKGPLNSCRIKVLLELFPEAKFVHIVRDPYVVFPSTMHFWKSMSQLHGLQRVDFPGLEEHVLTMFSRLYGKLEQGRQLVDPSRFYEFRYEDLVRDPEEQLRRLYEHLRLGGFEEYWPLMRRYLAEHADYKTNRYELTAEQRAMVTQRWGEVIRRYGYDQAVSPPPAPLSAVSIDGHCLDNVDAGGANNRRHGPQKAEDECSQPNEDHRGQRVLNHIDD